MSNHDRKGAPSANHDDAVDRAWHAASDEQPPAQLDAAIIGAAREAVSDRGAAPHAAHVRARSRHWFTSWQPLAAAATVAGLAFVLVQMLPRESGLAPSLQRPESVPSPVAAAPSQTVPQQAVREQTTRAPASPARTIPATRATVEKRLPETQGVARSLEETTIPDVAAARDAVPAPPSAPTSTNAATPPSSQDEVANGTAPGAATDDATVNSALAGAVTAGATAPVAAARENDFSKAEGRDATDRAAGIAAQYTAGDVTGAADALRAFRADDPAADRYLPDSLRAWARTVR